MAQFQSPGLTLGTQVIKMHQNFPDFKYTRENNLPTWKGELRPTPQSPVYRLKIVYKYHKQFAKAPKVWVLTPAIHPCAKHLYSDGSLCLYYPKDRSWTAYKYIADTIVPWAALWLLFYEIWLDTDHWYGPEAPHTRRKREFG